MTTRVLLYRPALYRCATTAALSSNACSNSLLSLRDIFVIQIQKRFNCSKRFRMMDSKPELIETIFSNKKSRSRFRFGEIQRRFLKCAFCDQKSEKNIKFQEFRNFDFNPKKSFFRANAHLECEFEFECLSRDGTGRTSLIILGPSKAQV